MDSAGRNKDLKERTRKFAVRIIHMYARLPKTVPAEVIGKQLLRCGTAVGAHYHEGVRSRSAAEYISKLETGLQELKETLYWLLLLVEAEIVAASRLTALRKEAGELSAILFACVRQAKKAPTTRNPE